MSSPELVDRSQQLGVLRTTWGEVVEGQPRVAVVVGEAGIGKTRFLDELATAIRGDEPLVLRGSCVRLAEASLPYAPVRAAFGELLPDGGPVTPDNGWLLHAIARVLDSESQQRPVLLAVEDLHWADAGTLELVDYLARALRRSRVLVVVNLRSEPPPRPAVADVVGELTRLPHTVRIVLPRLSPSGVAHQMRGILGRPPQADMAERVAARSEGVPFLVEELTAAEEAGEPGLPEQLHDLMVRRARGISPAARAVLDAAAIVGRSVTESTLVDLMDIDEAALHDALRELVDAALLTVDLDRRGYVFRHALVREAIEHDMLPGVATRLHERYAMVLGERAGRDDSAVLEAAHHWWLADNPDRAYAASLSAAEVAHRIGAYADELTMLQRCLAMWDKVGQPLTDTVPDRAGLLSRAGVAAYNGGAFDTARALIEESLTELGRPVQDPVRAAEVLADQASGLVDALGGDLPEVESALREILDALPPGQSRARGQVLSSLIQFEHHRRADPDLLEKLTAEAIACVDAAGDVQYGGRLRAFHASLVGGQPGRVEEGLALFAQARSFTERHDDVLNTVATHINESDFLIALGRFGQAAESARQGLALAKRRGAAVTMHDYLASNLTEALIHAGEWAQAAAVLEDSLLIDRPNLERAGLYTLLGLLRVGRGELAEAEHAAATVHARLDGTSVDPQFLVPLATLDAEIALLAGRPNQAVDLARAAVESAAEKVWPVLAWPLLHAAAIAVSQAGTASPPWLPSAVEAQRLRTPQLPWWAAVLEAELAGKDALLWDAAVDGLDAAAGPALLRLRARLAAARAHLAAGDRGRAATLLDEVLTGAAALGATDAYEQAAEVARKARLRTAATAPRAPMVDAGGLTPREHEVLRLVAAGRSNGAIAAELVISVKTVSVHVSHILDKLMASTRGEAAAVARQRGLI